MRIGRLRGGKLCFHISKVRNYIYDLEEWSGMLYEFLVEGEGEVRGGKGVKLIRIQDTRKGSGETYFGTTGSSGVFAASMASFQRLVHRHHLQPPFMPGIPRRSLPREAENSRNSSVTTAVVHEC